MWHCANLNEILVYNVFKLKTYRENPGASIYCGGLGFSSSCCCLFVFIYWLISCFCHFKWQDNMPCIFRCYLLVVSLMVCALALFDCLLWFYPIEFLYPLICIKFHRAILQSESIRYKSKSSCIVVLIVRVSLSRDNVLICQPPAVWCMLGKWYLCELFSESLFPSFLSAGK